MSDKFDELKIYLKKLNEQGLCLAFSGGIDSTLLLYLCKDLNVTAVSFKSVFQTDEEISEAQILCREYGVKHIVEEFFPLDNEILRNNPKDRCYHCKKLIFSKLCDFSKANNLKNVIDGTNADDLNTYRPGLKALEELGVISPFVKFGITKSEIREYAKQCGIKIYDKSSTPCMATRFPYGEKLSKDKLETVKKSENYLKNLGFASCRLRLHGNLARVEIPLSKFDEFRSVRECVIKYLKDSGITYVTLDMEGLRSGSMDV